MRRTSFGNSLSKLIVLVALAVAFSSGPLAAFEQPTGRVILEIGGKITHSNDGDGGAVFDREMLEELGLTEIVTDTPWTKGLVRFEGVLVRDLLKAVGATGTSIRAIAINDYAVNIPLEDFEKYPVILALKMNEQYMRVREKGPLWVIYPWHDNPDLRTEVYHSRSIWQLKHIVVE